MFLLYFGIICLPFCSFLCSLYIWKTMGTFNFIKYVWTILLGRILVNALSQLFECAKRLKELYYISAPHHTSCCFADAVPENIRTVVGSNTSWKIWEMQVWLFIFIKSECYKLKKQPKKLFILIPDMNLGKVAEKANKCYVFWVVCIPLNFLRSDFRLKFLFPPELLAWGT